jgi:hypothetical protein
MAPQYCFGIHRPETHWSGGSAMPLMAVTRLRIRSYRFLVPFLWQAWRSFWQAKQAADSFGAT